jgi:hypothetical protein
MRLMNTLRTLRGKRNPTPDHAAGLLAGDVLFDSLLVAHVARFLDTDAALHLPTSGQTTPPGRCGDGRKGAEHE